MIIIETVNTAPALQKAFLSMIFDKDYWDKPIAEVCGGPLKIIETVEDLADVASEIEGEGWTDDLSFKFVYKLESDIGGPGWFIPRKVYLEWLKETSGENSSKYEYKSHYYEEMYFSGERIVVFRENIFSPDCEVRMMVIDGTAENMAEWRHLPIQDAFPRANADQREFMLTGMMAEEFYDATLGA